MRSSGPTPAPGGFLQTLLILLTMLIGGTLGACGPAVTPAIPAPGGPTPTVTVPVDLPVTIALAGRFAPQALEILDEQIAAFETANPDLVVEVVRAPRDAQRRHERIATQLGAGEPSIDVVLLDATWAAEFAARGWLLSLDDRLPEFGIQTEDFLPGTLAANSLEGRLVALPWSADGGLLYYRRDLLEQVGYQPPSNWTDLQHMALDIRAKAGVPHGYVWQGSPDEDLTCNALEYVWSHGGDVLDEAGSSIFDSPETRAGLQRMSDLVLSGASPGDVGTYDAWKALAAFQSGEAVFMRHWFYVWEILEDEDSAVAGLVGVAALPASCLGGQSLGLSAHSQHPDRALRLMAFLVGYDQQVQLAVSANQLPVLQAAYADPALLAGSRVFGVLPAAFSAARARPAVAAYAEVSEAIYTEVHKMLVGEQDAAATAVNVQQRIESTLE